MRATFDRAFAKRLLNFPLPFALVVVGCVSCFYAVYAQAFADDYCRAALEVGGSWFGGVVSNVVDNYRHWSGRWVVHGIYQGTFPYIDVTSFRYNVLIAFSPVIWFGFFFGFVHLFFRDALARSKKAYLALVLTAVYFAGMPGPGETWFWLTGLVEYEVPVALIPWCLVLLTSAWGVGASWWRGAVVVLTAAAVAVIVTGLHELAGLMLLGLLAVGATAAVLRRRHDVALAFAFVAAVTVVGLGVNVGAPGTAARAAAERASGGWPATPSFLFAAKTAIFEPAAPVGWLGHSWLIWLSLLWLTSPWFYRNRPAWSMWRYPRPLVAPIFVVPLLGLAAACLCVFTVTYAQGLAPPARVQSIVYAFFMAMWLASMAAIPVSDRVIGLLDGQPAKALNVVASLLLPISLITAPNVALGISDMHYVRTFWSPKVEARDLDMLARRAAGETDLVLDPIPHTVRMYYWFDLGSSVSDFQNVCAATYYGADSLRVPPKAP